MLCTSFNSARQLINSVRNTLSDSTIAAQKVKWILKQVIISIFRCSFFFVRCVCVSLCPSFFSYSLHNMTYERMFNRKLSHQMQKAMTHKYDLRAQRVHLHRLFTSFFFRTCFALFVQSTLAEQVVLFFFFFVSNVLYSICERKNFQGIL